MRWRYFLEPLLHFADLPQGTLMDSTGSFIILWRQEKARTKIGHASPRVRLIQIPCQSNLLALCLMKYMQVPVLLQSKIMLLDFHLPKGCCASLKSYCLWIGRGCLANRRKWHRCHICSSHTEEYCDQRSRSLTACSCNWGKLSSLGCTRGYTLDLNYSISCPAELSLCSW